MNSTERALTLLSTALLACTVQGQLVVDETPTPAQLVNMLVDGSIAVSNIVYNGIQDPSTAQPGSGAFTQTGDLGMAAGVILATGFAASAVGPATNFSSDDLLNNSNDTDLEEIVGGGVTNYSVLEFDLVPDGDSLQLRYRFGSEEYPEYVCSFNDAFAIFLSGPGITGPFMGGAVSLSLLPDGITQVTIANVNGGYNNDPNDPNCPAVNPAYYVDNVAGEVVVYDGLTTLLTARAAVVAGETYHLKLAIGESGGGGGADFDTSFDSAVFLEAGSLTSQGDGTTDLRDHGPYGNDAVVLFGPNPTTGTLALRLDQDHAAVSLIVRDALGRVVVQRSSASARDIPLELDGPSGAYVVEVFSQGRSIARRKVLKM